MNEKVSIQSLFNILVTFFLRSVIDSLVYNVSCADPEYFTDMGVGVREKCLVCQGDPRPVFDHSTMWIE